jgi:hypothetical protein
MQHKRKEKKIKKELFYLSMKSCEYMTNSLLATSSKYNQGILMNVTFEKLHRCNLIPPFF